MTRLKTKFGGVQRTYEDGKLKMVDTTGSSSDHSSSGLKGTLAVTDDRLDKLIDRMVLLDDGLSDDEFASLRSEFVSTYGDGAYQIRHSVSPDYIDTLKSEADSVHTLKTDTSVYTVLEKDFAGYVLQSGK
ncbi:MAG: hypothetical protein ACQESC_03525 [Nanobdellota archaeon]